MYIYVYDIPVDACMCVYIWKYMYQYPMRFKRSVKNYCVVENIQIKSTKTTLIHLELPLSVRKQMT